MPNPTEESIRLLSSRTSGIVCESDKMKAVITHADRIIDRVSSIPNPEHVLICGETGSGKEVVAAHIMENIRPKFLGPKKPNVIKESCAAVNNTLADSILFGHVKGAFTGAITSSIGLLGSANDGILMLDDIDKMDIGLQAKLLRFLETGEYYSLGDIANKRESQCICLATCVERSSMLPDLYYRFKLKVNIPPLRERGKDIIALAKRIIEEDGDKSIPNNSLNVLLSYDWPGNVRELVAVCEYVKMVGSLDVKTFDDAIENGQRLPSDGNTATAGRPFPLDIKKEQTLKEVERAKIVKALIEHDWRQDLAAKALGISGRSMCYKVKKFGINRISQFQ